MYEVSVNGGTCFDPLVYHYPQDETAQKDYTSTFIVGNAIKVSPVLAKMEDNQNTFQAYFPAGNWVNLNNFGNIVKSTGQMVDLSS
jgi:alpha-glucosidase (family GH31 glycosyl hydrolase)